MSSTMHAAHRSLAGLLPALVLISTLVAVLATPRVQAQVSDDAIARQLYLRGDRLYNEGRYEQAVEIFLESYRLSQRPLLLFNLANAYERLGRYDEAIDALERYEPDAPSGERAQVRTRIESLTERADALRQGREPAPAPDPEPESRPTETTQPPAAQTTGASSSPLIVPGIALLVGAGALAIVGTVLGVLALDARSDAQAGCGPSPAGTLCLDSTSGALADDAGLALGADISFGVAIGAALVGGLLLVLGLMEEAEGEGSVNVSLNPRLDGGEVGVVGHF